MSMSKSRVQEAMCKYGIYQCSNGYRLEMVWNTYQRRNKGYTKRIGIRKSRRVETHWTHGCTNEFNAIPSLC